MTPGPNLSDDKARKILQRAAEIDRVASESVSVETLRAAAREAGIADSSFDAAVAEVTTAVPPAKPSRRSALRFQLAIVAAVFLLLGAWLFIGRAVPAETREPSQPPPPPTLPRDASAPRP